MSTETVRTHQTDVETELAPYIPRNAYAIRTWLCSDVCCSKPADLTHIHHDYFIDMSCN